MPGWWVELTDSEQYDYFRQMAIEYVKLNTLLNEDKELTDEAKSLIKENTEFLKKYNPFYPVWGLDFNLTGLIDSSLRTDIILGINYKRFFFRGRFYFSPGIDIKISKDILSELTTIGGGFSLGCGFLFGK